MNNKTFKVGNLVLFKSKIYRILDLRLHVSKDEIELKLYAIDNTEIIWRESENILFVNLTKLEKLIYNINE